jgi:hypothetical protein
MSFILKALKKLENEKVARKAAPVEINSAILAPDSGSSSSRGGKWLIISLVLIACAGAGTMFFFIHKIPLTVSEVQKAKPQTASAVQPISSLPTIQPQVDKPAKESASINTIDGQQATPRPREPEKRSKKAHLQNDFVTSSVPEPQGSFVAATPALTVSGIALQDDPAESMAVVNGVLVKSGMTVGGAVIDRIYLDRVRFKGSGGIFEVYLAK